MANPLKAMTLLEHCGRRVMITAHDYEIPAISNDGSESKTTFKKGSILVANKDGEVISKITDAAGAQRLALDVLEGVPRTVTDTHTQITLAAAVLAYCEPGGET